MSDENDVNIRIAISGGPDQGKSSLVGVLTTSKLDNGRGSARSTVLKTKHELESGRTSRVSFNPIVIPPSEQTNNKRIILTLLDLCGHVKYLKTSMHALTGLSVDYGVVIIAANMGLTSVTKEHMGILYHLKIPFVVVITKIDICPENVLQNTVKNIRTLFKRHLPNNKFYFIQSAEKDRAIFQSFTKSLFITPIFSLSNKTGEGVDVLKVASLRFPKGSRKTVGKTALPGKTSYFTWIVVSTFEGLVLSSRDT